MEKKSTPDSINDILNSLDNMKQAAAPSFFFTRLQAKMSKEPASQGSFWLLLTRPVVSLTVLSLLLVLNIAAINYLLRSDKRTDNTETAGIAGFAQEYNLSVTTVYNDKTIK